MQILDAFGICFYIYTSSVLQILHFTPFSTEDPLIKLLEQMIVEEETLLKTTTLPLLKDLVQIVTSC